MLRNHWLRLAGTVALIGVAAAESSPERPFAILQLRLLAGDGGVHQSGARTNDSFTVQATDETGRPLPETAVSFKLPEDGPSGQFLNGLRTSIVRTGPDGRATLRGVHWNQVAGPLQLRVTAEKDGIRAGLLSPQYVSPALAKRP